MKTIRMCNKGPEGETCSAKCPEDICSNRIIHIEVADIQWNWERMAKETNYVTFTLAPYF